MQHRLTALLIASCLTLSACLTPLVAPENVSRGDFRTIEKYISELVDREMSDHEITGISIALIDDQKIIWQKGFGFADLENRIPATPETIYRAGSISKVFTAAATMQLAEQGKIDIDQPLVKALPAFSIKTRFPDAAPVTPRNVMTHHSGLPSNYYRGLFVRNPEPFEVVLDEIRDEYLSTPPNTVFSYSNLGMALLGASVEKVSGQAFNEYMGQHFFQPLGMNRSSFASRAVTKAYDHNKPIEVFSLRDMPAANLLSNVVDLSQFVKMQFAEGRSGKQQILLPETTREMVRVQNANFPLTFDSYVGLGWLLSGIQVPGAGRVASHGGSLPDSHSMMSILPDHKLGVVILSNSATSASSVSKIASESLRLMLEAKTGIRPLPKTTVRAEERDPSEEELSFFNGHFDTLVGLVNVSSESGKINVDAVGHQFQLVPHVDGQLSLKYKLLGLMPVRVGVFEHIRLSTATINGRQIIIGKLGGETQIFGEKLRPAPIPESFKKLVGKYEIIDKNDGPTPDKILLKEEYGQLVGELSFPEKPELLLRIAFQPVSENEAITAGLGSGRGDTLRVIKKDGEDRLAYSGLLLRKILN
ncbi:MAG: beta-lactamase family protein [Dechloromonas sp.]|uniref:Beta-lactamase family protein n=1 Tax=Candidatus Dechloromonas phosphorivorans TaxID=2899244 RepID=A0A935JX60_9RHOO|nr:beta-lactamase family protein [Candidatus Dechloromonas phosphorivorans]